MAKQKLREMAASFTTHGNLPSQSVSQDFTELWDHIAAYSTLFRFVIGKLPPDLLQGILLEIVMLAVQHSFDESHGGVLPFSLLQSFIEDLLKENTRAVDSEDLYLASPALLVIEPGNQRCGNNSAKTISHTAVKISGGKGDETACIVDLLEQLKGVTSTYIAEVENIKVSQWPLDVYNSFVGTLYRLPKSHLVSLELRNIDSRLTNKLTQNLPTSVKRLSVARSPFETDCPYFFPETVYLTCLYLEYCTASIVHLLKANFPSLKKLSVLNRHHWYLPDVNALQNALGTGRMPQLEQLSIRFGHLRGFGQQLAGILKHPPIRNVELRGTNLSLNDGRILLRCIQNGEFFNHIFNLNLQNNEELGSIVQELQKACAPYQITIEVAPTPLRQNALPSVYWPHPLNHQHHETKMPEMNQRWIQMPF